MIYNIYPSLEIKVTEIPKSDKINEGGDTFSGPYIDYDHRTYQPFIQSCIMVDEIPYNINRSNIKYGVEDNSFFLGCDNKISYHKTIVGKNNSGEDVIEMKPDILLIETIGDHVAEIEEKLIFNALKSVPKVWSDEPFNANFINWAFRHVEESDNVVCNAIINPLDFEIIEKWNGMFDSIQTNNPNHKGQLWTANLYTSNLIPSKTTMILSAPNSVGVLSIISDKKSKSKHTAERCIIVQQAGVCWAASSEFDATPLLKGISDRRRV